MTEIEVGDALDLLRDLEDDSAECAIVDFPWEMDIKNGTGRFEYQGTADRAPSNGYRVKGHDGEMFDQIEDAAFPDVVEELARVLKPGSWLLCFADDRFQDPVRQTLRDVDGITFRRNWAWSPSQMGMGYYGRVDHYPIPAATVGETDRYVTGRGTLYRVKGGRQTDYPTGKPVSLYRRLLAPPVLQPGDTLLEPFCGHAPGAKVAHERGVDYWGADTNPEAVEAAQKRLKQQCIGQATLIDGGKND